MSRLVKAENNIKTLKVNVRKWGKEEEEGYGKELADGIIDQEDYDDLKEELDEGYDEAKDLVEELLEDVTYSLQETEEGFVISITEKIDEDEYDDIYAELKDFYSVTGVYEQ